MVEYYYRGEIRREAALPADLTLLEYLRNNLGQPGTKEGCASGDCGACTVVLVGLNAQDQLEYKTVNSCICPASELQGHELIAVEDLALSPTQLHHIQQSFVDQHASQCGFCTPGFVMSAFALSKLNHAPTELEVEEALAGNLCRCTGYRPIIDAVVKAEKSEPDQFDTQETERINALKAINARPFETLVGDLGLALPENLSQLKQQLERWPDAQFVAGSTDLGLEITQSLAEKPKLIGLSRVKELRAIEPEPDQRLCIGGGVTYSELLSFSRQNQWPTLEQFLLRIAAEQVRNRGTLGGNVANASPIGDMPPLLLALDAELLLWSVEGERNLSIDQFFLDYRKTALKPGEIIRAIRFKRPDEHFFAEKVSKRRDDDISVVCIGGSLSLSGSRIDAIRLGFGGMAATPKRASQTESALLGCDLADLSEATLVDLLQQDFQPMSDQRGSAEYRIQVAASVLYQALTEQQVGVAHD